MSEQQQILDQMARSLEQRVPDERSVAIVLSGNEGQCYYARRQKAKAVPPTSLLSGRRLPWSYLALLTHVFRNCLYSTEAIRRAQNWGKSALPVVVLNACGYIAPLLEQLKATKGSLVGAAVSPQRDPSLVSECRSAVSEVDTLCTNAVREMKRALMQRRFEGKRASVVHLHRCKSHVQVDWLDEHGAVLCAESVGHFVASMATDTAERLVAQTRVMAAKKTRIEERGQQCLAERSPALAKIARNACAADHAVGHLIGTFKSRGSLPMSIWLFVDPHGDQAAQAGAVLSAHRAHHEFILEWVAQRRFYFPPCLLVARMAFLLCHEPRIERPLLLQPRGGFHWNHPYSGELHCDPFMDAMQAQTHEPAMVSPSNQARELFPRLRRRLSSARSSDLCLDGQETRMEEIISDFAKSRQTGPQPDMLGLIDSLHEVAKTGATRSHELNSASTPRSKMDSEHQFYPLHGRGVTGTLAERIFPYSQ